MHGEFVIIEMQTWRGGIERDSTSSRAIVQAAKAIGPGIQTWNAGSASFNASGIEIVHAAQKFNSTKAKRRAKHPSCGPECCLQVTSRKDVRGRATHIYSAARTCCGWIVDYSEGFRWYSKFRFLISHLRDVHVEARLRQ